MFYLKSRWMKKMLIPIGIISSVIVLWQISVLNLLANGMIGTFGAFILLCLIYVAIGACIVIGVRRLLEKIKFVLVVVKVYSWLTMVTELLVVNADTLK